MPVRTYPPMGSPVVSSVAALLAGGGTLLLLQAGSGHDSDSRRFAALPEFQAWVWLYALEVAVAAAVGVAMLPSFLRLGRSVGRRTSWFVVCGWWLAAVLLVVLGPRPMGVSGPLWLGEWRGVLANCLTLLLVSSAFGGLVLAQIRLSAMRREIAQDKAVETPGALIVELLLIRAEIHRFLVSFAALVTLGVLALGALRGALLAYEPRMGGLPPVRTVAFGVFLAALTALIFLPAYLTWQGRVAELRVRLYPVPVERLPDHSWHEARGDFDGLLSARLGALSVFGTAFAFLTPLVGTIGAALISAR